MIFLGNSQVDEAQQAGKMLLEFHKESRDFLRGLSEQLGEKTPQNSPKFGKFWAKNQEFKGFFPVFQPPERSGTCRAPPRGGCWRRNPKRRRPRGGNNKKRKKSQKSPDFPSKYSRFYFLNRLFLVWRCAVVIGWCGCQSEGPANHRAEVGRGRSALF